MIDKKYLTRFLKYSPIALAYIVCIGIWELLVRFDYIPERFLPKPSKILATFLDIVPEIKTDILYTIYASATGLTLSVIIAITIVVLMDVNKKIKDFFLPIIVLTQAIPIIVLAPLFVLWFGFDLFPKILIVVIVCVFPLTISLFNGMESTDINAIRLLKIMGANKLQIIKHVKFPNALIDFFSGLQMAATYSVIGAIIGEWMGGNKGLGVFMLKVKNSFQIEKVFAVVLITIIITLIYWGLILIIQRIYTSWKYKT